jgi:glycosyltransferase involved in cell wall biosynthesis
VSGMGPAGHGGMSVSPRDPGAVSPVVSVVTVCLNAAAGIEETLRSVVHQTYEKTEYIVVDGGSTDGTLEIISRYNSGINRCLCGPDRGIYDAMNKGARAAGGDVIYFLNAGDILCGDGVVAGMAGRFAQDPVLELAYGRVLLHDPESGTEMRIGRGISVADLRKGKGMCHQSLFMKRSSLLSIGGFDISYRLAADFDMLCRCFMAGMHADFFPVDVARYRLEGVSSVHDPVAREYARIISGHFGAGRYVLYAARQRLQSVRSALRRLLLAAGILNRMKRFGWYRDLMSRIDY